MVASDNLLTLINSKMSNLTKGQKIIGKFILDHYDKAVYLTAARLGEVVGVSESTVVRFALELGYDGYPMLRRDLSDIVKVEFTPEQRMEDTIYKVTKGNKHIVKSVMEHDIEKINGTLSKIDLKVFDEVIDKMTTCNKIYLLGGRSSYSIANFFGFYLNLMIDGVILINGSNTSEIFEQLMRIEKDDILIAISFPRYSKQTIESVKYAKSRGSKTIVITDTDNSPVAIVSDYKLIAQNNMFSIVDSLVAPMSVVNAILVAISIKRKIEVVSNFNNLEKLWIDNGVYETRFNEHGKS